MNKRILVAINHPAQYHFLKNVIRKLSNHEIHIVIREKDILKKLLDLDEISYSIVGIKAYKGNNKFKLILFKFLELIIQDYKLFRVVRKFKPDLMIGTDIAITHIGYCLHIPSFVFNEDDFEINKMFCRFSYPFATYIITPSICNVGKYSFKQISYQGYQKLTYLNPVAFQRNKDIVFKSIDSNVSYFLIRMVSFKAGHDIEQKHSGISKDLLIKLIELLSSYGKVYITSEGELAEAFKAYQLKINPLDIHHFIAYSSLFISDSQSMTMEAAMLGTPSIRFNSFVGKISVLNELETKYGLTFGIPINNEEMLFKKVVDLLSNKNLVNDFSEKRMKMLDDKIDVTDFLVQLINSFFDKNKMKKHLNIA